MDLQKFLQKEIDTIINKYKETYANAGRPITELEEMIFRQGIQYGYVIASKVLCNLPIDENLVKK